MVRDKGAFVIPGRMPVAFACTSNSTLNALADEARRLSKQEDFLLLLSNRKETADNILPAYLNACIRYKEGKMRSGSLQMELLLFMAGTFRISAAIEQYGARDSKDFIAVCGKRQLLAGYARRNQVRLVKELKLRMGKDFVPPIE